MISRTMGPEFGGAIGTLFFFANIASSALCISACTEALVENFGPTGYLISDGQTVLPDSMWWRFLYRSLLNMVGLGISLAGASLFARTSLAIWATVVICLASTFISFFITGPKSIPIPDTNHLVQNSTTGPVFANYTALSRATLTENLYAEYDRDYTTTDLVDLATVFGVLFTGVTGVMAGANMSGELKNPGRSIPVGTLAALLFTAVSYVCLSLLTAAACPRFLLQNNYVYLLPINVWPPFIAAGMLTATFSAGLSNLIGASRVLEALARDNIYGVMFRWLVPSRTGSPTAAVLVSWALVQLGVCVGSLNAIAQVNSVLFMTSYFAVNLACLGLDLASAPNFRPTFTHFSWVTSLLGLLGAATAMFLVRAAYAVGAALACLSLVLALHLWSPAAADPSWGSLSQALIFHQVRKYLLLLDPRREHVKYWRPQMLLLISSPRQACPLIDFVNDQKKGGLFVLGHVRVGQLDSSGDPLAPEQKYWLSLIDHLKVKAFVELCLADSVRSGAAHLARLSGLGAMRPDTVILGFSDDTEPVDFFRSPTSPYKATQFDDVFQLRERQDRLSVTEYVQILSDVLAVRKNLCICRHFHKLNMEEVEKSPHMKYIDVWLSDLVAPRADDPFTVRALFMLQLGAVVRSARGWTRLGLRLFYCEGGEREGGGYVADGNVVQASSQSQGDLDSRLTPLLTSSRPAEVRLVELLKLLRIQASIHKVSEWSTMVEPLRNQQDSPRYGSDDDDATVFSSLPEEYISSVNDLIKKNTSENTAVTFIYLPPPPRVNQARLGDGARLTAAYSAYLHVLDGFTRGLPPTILVHGTKSVTSTAL